VDGVISCIQKAPREQLRGSYSQLHSRRKCCTVYRKTFLLFLDRGTALSNDFDSFPILREIVRVVQGQSINLHLRLNHVGVLTNA